MTYHYKGKEIGNRPAAVNFIITLPYNELYNFVYTYLDHFDEEHLKDMIWASVDNRDKGWTMAELVEGAMLMMENDWEGLYDLDSLEEGESVFIGPLEYDNWRVEE